MQQIRANQLIQAQVQERLREIQEANVTGTNTKSKSLGGGAVEVIVPNRIKWPHEFVLAGNSKERVTYDQLSVIQWVTGFCRTMKEEHDTNTKDCMMDYMIALLEDAQDFSWEAAKASHAVLLCRMEQGEIQGYHQTEKIDRIRRANAQRHLHANLGSGMAKTNKTTTCQYYNKGSCNFSKNHETRGIWYKHVCSHCFSTTGKSFTHPETECRNKRQDR